MWWIFMLPACRSVEPTVLPALPHSNRPVVFVADGAGDFRACSGTLRDTVDADGVSLEVITFVWSHGYLRNIADQTDLEHSRQRGEVLANMVRHSKERFPDAPVTLLGHSAGSAVVLSAAESLPPESLDRIVLLAPSLSVDYDLRPALTSTKNGIDVFISEKDWLWLGLIVRLFGTTDNPRAARAAGRFGFVVSPTDGDDSNQYTKLRLHRWMPGQEVLGHDGGHFGWYQPGVLRNLVLPILTNQNKKNVQNSPPPGT